MFVVSGLQSADEKRQNQQIGNVGFDKTDKIKYRFWVRIRGKSDLDPYTEEISQIWREKRRISEIHKELNRRGCSIGRTAIRDWIERKIEAGELPVRDKSTPPQREKHSLGLLDAVDDLASLDRISKILRILWLPTFEWSQKKIQLSLGLDGFGLPLTRDGEPDYSAYAREVLGPRGVRSLGDMDFVLFALWTREVRELPQIPGIEFSVARQRSVRVLEVAAEIRSEMLAAVSPK